MLPTQPGYQVIKELPASKGGKRIILQRPAGKNPFLQTEVRGFQQTKQQAQQPNQLQSQIAEVIYNKITAQQPSILTKDTLVVEEGSILDQIIRRHKQEARNARQGHKPLRQQQEIAQASLNSSRAILDSYQPRGKHQSQPPAIARTRKNQQLTTSPKQQKSLNQKRIPKTQKQVYDISDAEDSTDNIPSVPIQTAISGYNQDATSTIQQSAQQLNQIARGHQGDMQLNQLEEVIKNLSSVVKGRPASSKKNKQNVQILQARPQCPEQFYATDGESPLDVADADGSGIWRGDLQGIIEKPPAEAALEDPVIQLCPDVAPDFSFSDHSYNTMNVRKSQAKPEANEFTVKKTHHKPIEITAERDSFSSGLQSVQAINQIDQQAQKLLEAQENEPEVQLPICDVQRPGSALELLEKSATPEGQSFSTPKVSKEDIATVVKEVLPGLLGQMGAQDASTAELERRLEAKVQERILGTTRPTEISPLPQTDYNLSESNVAMKQPLDEVALERQEQLRREQEEKLKEIQEKEQQLQQQEAERLKALERQNEKEKRLSEKEAELEAKEEEIRRLKELLEQQLQEKQKQTKAEEEVQQKIEVMGESELIVEKVEETQQQEHLDYNAQNIEYIQIDGTQASEKDTLSDPEPYEHARVEEDFSSSAEQPKYEETPQPNNPALRDIPIRELSNDELLNHDYFDDEPGDRPLNRSGHRSQSHSIHDQTSLPPEALDAVIAEAIPEEGDTVEIIPVAPVAGCDYSSVTDLFSSPERRPELVIDDQSEPRVVQVIEQEKKEEKPIQEEQHIQSSPIAPVSQLSQYEMANSGPEVQLDAVEVEGSEPESKAEKKSELSQQEVEDTKPLEKEPDDFDATFDDLEEPVAKEEQKQDEKPINIMDEHGYNVTQPHSIQEQPKEEELIQQETVQQEPVQQEPQKLTPSKMIQAQNKTIPDQKHGIDADGDMFYVPDTLCTRGHFGDFVDKFLTFLEDPLKYEEPIEQLFTKQDIQVADYILDQLEIVHDVRLKSKPGKQQLRTSDDIIQQNELGDLISVEIENGDILTLKKIIPELFQKLAKKPCIEEATRQPIKQLERLIYPSDDELLAQCLEGVDGLLDDVIDEVVDVLLTAKLPAMD